MTKHCLHCNADITDSHYRRKYCNNSECKYRGTHKQAMIKLICIGCGIEFKKYQHQVNKEKRHYHDRTCAANNRRKK